MKIVVRSDDNDIKWGLKGEERKVQNVRNILRTKKFEVPFNRDLGINPDFVDNSVVTMTSELIDDITKNINKYQPDVNVTDVKVEEFDANGNVVVAVEIEV